MVTDSSLNWKYKFYRLRSKNYRLRSKTYRNRIKPMPCQDRSLSCSLEYRNRRIKNRVRKNCRQKVNGQSQILPLVGSGKRGYEMVSHA